MTREYRRWRASEDRYLIRSAGIVPLWEMASRLDRSAASIKTRIHRINEARGLTLTTSTDGQPERCERCGNLTYLERDAAGWCEHCQIEDAVEFHRRCLSDDQATLDALARAKTEAERRDIRKAQRRRNQEKVRVRRREEHLRKAQAELERTSLKKEVERLRREAGLNPRGGETDSPNQLGLFDV